MRTNPGGQIDPSEVIGRDKLIQNLWRILERQSLVLSAERRIGKTCAIKKMVNEASEDKLTFYHDLEGVRTSLEFVEIIFRDVEHYLSGLKRTAERTRHLLAQLSGAEFQGFKFPDITAPHWKNLLTETIEDLVEHQDRTVTFFWDEMPLMLYNIKQQADENAAMEVLDILRSLRQMHPDLRMVFTGSIGLHNILASLRQAGYANAPTNDMNTVEIPPLSPADAQELAHRLLEGESIQTDNPQAMARAVANSVDGIPYFIHHLIDQIVQRGSVTNETTVSEIVDACLRDPQDAWNLRYYRDRINTYYAPDERPFALNLLDILSTTDRPLSFDDVFNLLKSRIETEDSEMARDVLTMLQRDHYLVQQANGAFCFRFPLIQRCWKFHRGLTS